MDDARSADDVKLSALFFSSSHMTGLLENEITEIVAANRVALDGHDVDWTSDDYDNSIEVYGVMPTAALHDALKAAGFSIVWQHNHDQPRGDCKCPAKRPEGTP